MKVLQDSAKFGLFLMLFNSLYKLVLCLLRRLGSHDDRINAPIAGFVCGLSIAADSKSRRMLVTALIMSRACDMGIRKAEGHTVKIPHKDIILWVVCNSFL